MFKKLEERTNILRKETEYIERPTVYEMKKYTGWNKKQIGHQRKNSWTWEQSSSKLFKMKQRDKKDKENEHQLALGQNINVKYKYKCKNINVIAGGWDKRYTKKKWLQIFQIWWKF